jgi:hypothetical protein
LAASARIVWVVLLVVADPVDLATSVGVAPVVGRLPAAGACAVRVALFGVTPFAACVAAVAADAGTVGATSSAGGISAKSRSDASNDMVAEVGSAAELGDVVAPTGLLADAAAGNVAPAGDVPGGTFAGAGPRAEVGPPLAGARSPTASLAGFPDRGIFPARREITAARTIPAATMTMTNTS